MRRTLPLLGLLLTTATADAGPLADPAPWVLPVNAFARARPGDWTILEGDAVIGGKTMHEREVIRVGAVARGVAEVQLFEGAAGNETWFLSFPVDMKRGPDTNLLYDVPWIATGMARVGATCALGRTSLPCTRVTYQTTSSTVTVLMAPRVRGSGIVSYQIVSDEQPVWTMTTIGYGTAGKVEWGVGPPRADLDTNRDTSMLMIGLREGSEHATEDVYEGGDDAALGVPPRVDLDDVAVTGDMDKAIVRRYVKRQLPHVNDCYQHLLAKKPRVGGGTVIASFTIDERSLVTELSAAGSAHASLRWCVTENLSTIEFPRSDGGGRNAVVCTFTFDPGKPKPKKPIKRPLISRGHPMRGGPDLRGVTITRGP